MRADTNAIANRVPHTIARQEFDVAPCFFLRAADSFWVRSSQFWCSAAARLRTATESGSKRPSAQLEYSAFKAFEKACSKRRTLALSLMYYLLARVQPAPFPCLHSGEDQVYAANHLAIS